MKCPSCGTTLLLQGLERCPYCGAQIPVARGPQPPTRMGRFVVEQGEEHLRLFYRWYQPGMWMLEAFALMAIGVYIPNALIDFGFRTAVAGLIIAFLNYAALTLLVNRTELILTHAALRVRRGPLPWPGSMEIPKRHIAQLQVRKVAHRHKNRTKHSFSLEALMQGNYSVSLLGGFQREYEAVQIAQLIERWLGSENFHVNE